MRWGPATRSRITFPSSKSCTLDLGVMDDTEQGMRTNKSFKGSFGESAFWNTAGVTVIIWLVVEFHGAVTLTVRQWSALLPPIHDRKH